MDMLICACQASEGQNDASLTRRLGAKPSY